LLHTGLHRAANRHPDDVDLLAVAVVLDTVSRVDVARGYLLTAGTLPGQLRSDDAVHPAVALRIGVDEGRIPANVANAGDFWAADYRECRVCQRWTLLGCSGGAALGS